MTHLYMCVCVCVFIFIYSTNHPQLKWSMCVTCGVNHTRMGFLDSTHVYTHTQYLHTCVILHVCMLVC